VNYDNSLVVTTTVTCNLWAPSSGDNLFTCGAIYLPPHVPLHWATQLHSHAVVFFKFFFWWASFCSTRFEWGQKMRKKREIDYW